MTVDNSILIQDPLTLIVMVAQMPLSGIIVTKVGGEERAHCIRSLRASPKELEWLRQFSPTYRYFNSWKSFVGTRDGRWRSGRLRCYGCGKHLKHHKP